MEWPSGKQRHMSQKESLGHIYKDLNVMLRNHLLSECILGTVCELLEWEFQALEKRDGIWQPLTFPSTPSVLDTLSRLHWSSIEALEQLQGIGLSIAPFYSGEIEVCSWVPKMTQVDSGRARIGTWSV